VNTYNNVNITTASPGYGVLGPPTPLTVGTVYTTNNTSLAGGSGAGQFYTTTGTNGTSWTNSFNNSNGKPIMTLPAGTDEIVLEKDATLTVKGKVVINDRDLEERLDIIEKVLMIPERDVILEKKHPKLKKLFDEYINALEKYKTFERIKGDYD